MRISDVIRGKGSAVVTVRSDISVRELLAHLAEHHIGAAVVSPDGERVEGIVSERDIVRALAARGASVLSEQVVAIMTSQVRTCVPTDTVDSLMHAMTQGRFRHVPVVVDETLVGIVSIGDVVKTRLGELETEREALATYIATAST